MAAQTAGRLYERYLGALRMHGVDDSAGPINARLPAAPDMDLNEILQQLDTLKGWLDSFRPLPPAVVAELKHLYDVRFTYHSNAIEGNTLTQSETEMVLTHGITVGGKTLVEHLEVVGHKDAIDYVEELAQQGTPIGEWEIKGLHSLILRGVDQVTGQNEAGRYRTLDVRAAGTEHVYPPHYRLPELMEGFVAWLSSGAAAGQHPVEYAAEAHYRFVSIHPFRDGNGRAGRLLMNLVLLRAGYPIAVIPNERRGEYIDALVHAQEHGQEHGGDTGRLTRLIALACRESFVEYLRTLSTAADSQGRGLPFYQEMVAFLQSQRHRHASVTDQEQR
jgi:Fic family protein